MAERINNRLEYDNVQQDISAELQDQGDAERVKRIAAVHDKMAALAMGEMDDMSDRELRRIEFLLSSPIIAETDHDKLMEIIEQDVKTKRENWIKSVVATNAPSRKLD